MNRFHTPQFGQSYDFSSLSHRRTLWFATSEAAEWPAVGEEVVERILATMAQIPPRTVGGSDRAKDLFGYFDDLIARLRSALS